MIDSVPLIAEAHPIEKWDEFFSARIKRNQTLKRGYLEFVRGMQGRGIPPIFETVHLRKLIGLAPFEFSLITSDPAQCYHKFEIAKRSGGMRTISAPAGFLLTSQRWILENILYKEMAHDAAHGYVKNRSHLTNALEHIDQRQVLKVDIKDFFGSIPVGFVIKHFASLGYPPHVAFCLGQICSNGICLPQGAATSPALSNLYMKTADEEIAAAARDLGYRYTRYADDITISGDKIEPAFVDFIEACINRAGLLMNQSKTRWLRGRKKIITGISIGSGTAKIPRKLRRQIKNSVFILQKQNNQQMIDSLPPNPFWLERVTGQVAYWLLVSPKDRVAQELSVQLSKIRQDSMS